MKSVWKRLVCIKFLYVLDEADADYCVGFVGSLVILCNASFTNTVVFQHTMVEPEPIISYVETITSNVLQSPKMSLT